MASITINGLVAVCRGCPLPLRSEMIIEMSSNRRLISEMISEMISEAANRLSGIIENSLM